MTTDRMRTGEVAAPVAPEPAAAGRRIRPLLMVLDAVVLAAGLVLVSAVWSPGPGGAAVVMIEGVASLVWIGRTRLYRSRFITRRADEIRRIVYAAIRTAATVALAGVTLRLDLDRSWLAAATVATVVLLTAERELVRRHLKRLRTSGRLVRRVLLVGDNTEAAQFQETFETEPDVELSSTLADIASDRLTVRPLGRFPVVYVEPRHRHGWRAVAKRLFDLVLAGGGLVVAAPVLALAAVAVKATSPGPVLFRQERVGRDGEPFQMLKLRTMVVGAEARLVGLRDGAGGAGPLFKLRHDPRVTTVGGFLRCTSLDELPQLWNVMRNEMSMVGPRPALRSEMAGWGPELYSRLRVKPGITGMWQVSGRSSTTFEEYTRHYVDN